MTDPALLLAARDYLWICPDKTSAPKRVALPWSHERDAVLATRSWLALLAGRLPAGGLSGIAGELPGSPIEPVRVGDAVARAVVETLGRKAIEAPAREVAAARLRLPAEVWRPDREKLLAYSDECLKALLSSPGEVVISLSREGDRLDRLLQKEKESLGALAAGTGPDTLVASYAKRSEGHVAVLEERRRALDHAIEEAVTRLLPNTSAVVGARTAARLLAHTGSPRALLHLNASQLQIAGAGRRKPGSPTPRHGVLYHAEGMDRVPFDRRGALARSMASWAVVAVRADLLTQGSVGAELAERRERRIQALSEGRPRRRFPSTHPPLAAPRGAAAPFPRGGRTPERPTRRPPPVAAERGREPEEPVPARPRGWNSPGPKFARPSPASRPDPRRRKRR